MIKYSRHRATRTSNSSSTQTYSANFLHFEERGCASAIATLPIVRRLYGQILWFRIIHWFRDGVKIFRIFFQGLQVVFCRVFEVSAQSKWIRISCQSELCARYLHRENRRVSVVIHCFFAIISFTFASHRVSNRLIVEKSRNPEKTEAEVKSKA